MTRLKTVLKRKWTVLGLAAILGAGAFTLPLIVPNNFIATASAQNSKSIVDAAKDQGIVGEQADGYLGLVTGSASKEIRDAVNDINIKRKTYYTDLARRKNESVGDVGKVAAIELAAKAARGHKLKTSDGRWITK